MRIAELLPPDHIVLDARASSKKRVLEMLSELLVLGGTPLTPVEVFESLLSRERLGGTGLGEGVAIPHGRMKNARQTLAAFMRLAEGIDFDAPDEEPVDLLFALLVPEDCTDEHLQVLASLARILSDPAMRRALREADSPEACLGLLSEDRPPD
jgi:PTS system nitrogen regulatory IIA component